MGNRNWGQMGLAVLLCWAPTLTDGWACASRAASASRAPMAPQKYASDDPDGRLMARTGEAEAAGEVVLGEAALGEAALGEAALGGFGVSCLGAPPLKEPQLTSANSHSRRHIGLAGSEMPKDPLADDAPGWADGWARAPETYCQGA
jgi:hypothetical protein